MIKLPPEEALRRRKERSKKHNDLQRLATAARRLAEGIIPVPVTEERKEAMRLYSRQKRAEAKALLPPKPPKQVKLKTTKPEKPIKVQPVLKPKVMPRPKATKTQPRIFKTLKPDPTKIKVRLDHRTEVYIRPDQDIEAVKARYLNR